MIISKLSDEEFNSEFLINIILCTKNEFLVLNDPKQNEYLGKRFQSIPQR